MKTAVFLERDGVLNRVRLEKQIQVAPRTLEEFEINGEAVSLLQQLKAAGLILLATTNQPGLSGASQCRWELDRMHRLLCQRLKIDEVFVCPHDEADECPCRKPRPGLFTEAAFKWQLDLERSFVVSDKWQDARAAQALGCTSLLIQSPWNGSVHRDFLLPSLEAAVQKILQLQRGGRRMPELSCVRI